eukprot:GFYU01002522.1.p1 GENE.GFYU01002522.1~~GFYU01002522.1.p1  ORF type:complete len:483 (-),score=76.51 GFYU01002522.1:215-1663(-)
MTSNPRLSPPPGVSLSMPSPAGSRTGHSEASDEHSESGTSSADWNREHDVHDLGSHDTKSKKPSLSKRLSQKFKFGSKSIDARWKDDPSLSREFLVNAIRRVLWIVQIPYTDSDLSLVEGMKTLEALLHTNHTQLTEAADEIDRLAEQREQLEKDVEKYRTAVVSSAERYEKRIAELQRTAKEKTSPRRGTSTIRSPSSGKLVPPSTPPPNAPPISPPPVSPLPSPPQPGKREDSKAAPLGVDGGAAARRNVKDGDSEHRLSGKVNKIDVPPNMTSIMQDVRRIAETNDREAQTDPVRVVGIDTSADDGSEGALDKSGHSITVSTASPIGHRARTLPTGGSPHMGARLYNHTVMSEMAAGRRLSTDTPPPAPATPPISRVDRSSLKMVVDSGDTDRVEFEVRRLSGNYTTPTTELRINAFLDEVSQAKGDEDELDKLIDTWCHQTQIQGSEPLKRRRFTGAAVRNKQKQKQQQEQDDNQEAQ